MCDCTDSKLEIKLRITGETGHFQIEEKKEENIQTNLRKTELFKANYSSQMMSCCQRRSLFSNQNAIMKLDTKNEEENEDSLQLTKSF